MSGGVDSSVSAYELKKNGYEVVGVTSIMCGNEAIDDAQKVCEQLGIEHRVVDMRTEFKCHVMDYFASEYMKCRTPNPCNMCNRYVKFEVLLRVANEVGADYVATGHYANIVKLDNGRYSVKNSSTATKDQTYALCFLTQNQLAHTMMPLGGYTKEQVREIAAELNLSVADKKDSQDICFIPDKDYGAFLDNYLSENDVKNAGEISCVKDKNFAQKPGNFVDENGNILGKHKGMAYYTYGQRRGLGVAAKTRLCIIDMKPESNEIVLAEDDKAYSSALTCSNMNWMSEENPDNKRVWVKIRYAHKGEWGTLINKGDRYIVEFEQAVRAITPGQPVVFYDGDYVLGAGIIDGRV